ncbi:uncharacterized protein Dwil_GK26847 [Drosophila willistoni]|uniref:Uncharacterized protein n=1 Tax=Drosophila willistoni TaxID=7260 RepID=A0A0Q9WVH1_DROWI|nr:uncharacterized protein Dwil_GK26847 [Drosophila willistoni]
MHIAGLIITTFFSSNLTAMMTKRPELNHVRNFEELRESNLTVVVDALMRRFIERSVDAEFFKNTVSNFLVVSTEKETEMLLSLNNSYAYVDKLRQFNSDAPLTFKSLNLAWNVLIFGYGMALIIFLIEIFMAYCQRRRQMQPVIIV